MTKKVQHRRGTWQNLVKGCCPYDGKKLRRDGKVYACDECDYYITPHKMLDFLRDPKSHVRVHLSAKDAKKINKALAP